jgi:hypothetical protein
MNDIAHPTFLISQLEFANLLDIILKAHYSENEIATPYDDI